MKYLVPKSRMREIRTYGSVVGPARETGSAYPIYYLGAMIFSYAFGTFSIIPTVVAMVFWAEAPLSGIVLVPSLQLILMNPLLFKYSRLAWLYLDHAADPG